MKPQVEQLEDRLTPATAWYTGPAGVPASVFVPGDTVPAEVCIATYPGSGCYQWVPTVAAPVLHQMTLTAGVTPLGDGTAKVTVDATPEMLTVGAGVRLTFDAAAVRVLSAQGSTPGLQPVQIEAGSVAVLWADVAGAWSGGRLEVIVQPLTPLPTAIRVSAQYVPAFFATPGVLDLTVNSL